MYIIPVCKSYSHIADNLIHGCDHCESNVSPYIITKDIYLFLNCEKHYFFVNIGLVN